MSASQDDLFDLEQLFLPAWAKKPSTENRFAHFEAEPGREERRGPRRDRGDRPPGRRDQAAPLGPRAPGRAGPPRGPRREGGPPRGHDRPPRVERRPAPPPPQPLPAVNVAFVPDVQGVDSLARQIRMSGRAYPLFEIAHMILAKPERYTVTFSVLRKAEGGIAQPLFVCALDETLWLSREEAITYALEKHFNLFYQAERTQIEPPKGTYTFVAQCGLSGVILGPPNHHDYQNRLRRLHQERFARMPFEAFKARVRIVRDDAVVKKWIEDQSYKTEYLCLNMPEPLRLGSREEVEKHFREIHAANVIQEVETHHMTGVASRGLRSSGLARLARQTWEEQRRFPLQIATVLSQQFSARGLQFFKVNRTVTHVAVARPHHLDLDAAPVSEGVRRIVAYINVHPKCTRKQLLEVLAPVAAMPPTPMPATAPAEPPAPPGGASTPVEGAAQAAVPPPPPPPTESPELTAVMTDLHWLIHQGHVIEFANGVLDTAKKPVPRPPKPEPQAAAPTAPGVTEAAGAESGPAGEATTPAAVAADVAAEAAAAVERAEQTVAEPVGPAEAGKSDPDVADTPAASEEPPPTPVIDEKPPQV